MKHRFMSATAIAVSLPLSGCGGMLDFGTSKSASAVQESGALDMSEYFERRLAAGHRHLSQGRLSKALTAFRQAAGNESTTAAACNGLAIAYDRLGRTDLAEKYFKQAVSFAEPDDFRYARNLARFEGKQLRRKMDREAARKALLARRETPAPAPVEQVAEASDVELPKQTSFEEAFAHLSEDAPLVRQPAVESKRARSAAPAPAQLTATVPAPAPRPVVAAKRSVAPAPVVRVATAPAPRIRTTGRLVAHAPSAPPTRSAGVRIENRQVSLVRVSKNEVRIGRPAYSAQANISSSPETAIPSEPSIPSDGGDQTELQDTGLSDASQALSSESAARTPLALAEAWTSIQSGS